MKKMAVTLQDRLASIIQKMNYELVGCEWQAEEPRGVLRIYIDSPNGITVDDCSRVSHQVSAVVNVENLIQEHYSLEVSSPGLDRPLFEIAHYKQQIGHRVKVRTYAPIQDKRQFVGVLLRVDGNDIHLLVNNIEEVVLPFSNIEKANIIADIR